MKIAISSGHGLHIRGARGNPVPPELDEVDQARRVVDRVTELLNDAGVPTVKFHDNTSYDQSTNLNTIVSWHNRQSRDYDISVHFNATAGAYGTEVWYYSQGDLAAKVSAAIAAAGGFKDRGKKRTTGLYFLMHCSQPAILIETCFCDSTDDSNKYTANFEAICVAIAESVSGVEIESGPPSETPPEQGWPEDPLSIPVENRPVVGMGDEGYDVRDLQYLLNQTNLAPGLGEDGDFGNLTETAVEDYQASRGLDMDGICGQQTWGSLYDNKPPLPPPPHALTEREIEAVCNIARSSWIAQYSWRDRGVAPPGYTQGMALAFAQSMKRLIAGHPAEYEMARERTNSDKDVLHLWRTQFETLGMSNEVAGLITLRHLYAFMLGSGMRESSGRHCEGRDQSASNTTSDTAEAGLFQTSWNAHSASDPEFSAAMEEFSQAENRATCYLSQFDDGVSCSSSEWSCYGSGNGYTFQKLCKDCPTFAVITHGLTLRNLCNHYGPVVRGEVELKREADDMFRAIEAYMNTLGAIA